MRAPLMLAFGYLDVGLDDAAVAVLREAFSRDPDSLGDALALAEAAWRDGGVAAGRAAFAAVAEGAADPAAWGAWARRARAEGEDAATVLAEGQRRFPDDADLIHQQAALEMAEGRCDAALTLLDRLDGTAARHPYVLCNRGHALLGLDRLEEASACFDAVLADDPRAFLAVYGRALVAFARRDDTVAEAGLRAAAALDPHHREARFRLAEVLARLRRFADARAELAAVLADNPDDFTALYQTAVLHGLAEDYAETILWSRRALAVDPARHEVYDLLGLALVACGRTAEAAPCFARAAQALTPQAPAHASNRAFVMHYDPARSADELFAVHREWGERFGGAGEDPAARFANSPEPERRLRVGYVSPDLRAHSVAYFAIPLLAGHGRAAFEVFAYSATDKPDGVTAWLREQVDGWRDIVGLSPEAVRTQIAADRIDILVDLAGHTAANLLPVFARRAAPVQLTYIGYPDTTGVPAIDYRIVDGVTDPPGAERFASEELLRLGRPFLAYRPVPDRPEVAAPTGAAFTFGSFNTALKLNDRVFDAWSAILDGAPGTRLMLKAKQFHEAATRDWVRSAFADRGVDPARLDTFAFLPTLGSHLEVYNRVDLALDTFPYNGTTTTCEALSMGVPVLSLKGDRHMARVAETLLRATGIDPVFLAADVDDYVRRAIDYAGRRDELAAMRPEIHRRLLASELCDEAGLVAAVEAAYRQAWRRWCAEGPRCGLGPSPFERELAACART